MNLSLVCIPLIAIRTGRMARVSLAFLCSLPAHVCKNWEPFCEGSNETISEPCVGTTGVATSITTAKRQDIDLKEHVRVHNNPEWLALQILHTG